MSSVLPLVPPDASLLSCEASFDPESLMRLGQAFDLVCGRLHLDSQPSFVKEVVAARLIELAVVGRNDPIWLCEATLTALGQATK